MHAIDDPFAVDEFDERDGEGADEDGEAADAGDGDPDEAQAAGGRREATFLEDEEQSSAEEKAAKFAAVKETYKEVIGTLQRAYTTAEAMLKRLSEIGFNVDDLLAADEDASEMDAEVTVVARNGIPCIHMFAYGVSVYTHINVSVYTRTLCSVYTQLAFCVYTTCGPHLTDPHAMPVTRHAAQVVITRLLAEEDPAWISKMDDEVRLGKSILAKTALLRSATGLAEVALQQEGTVAATCAALAPCLYALCLLELPAQVCGSPKYVLPPVVHSGKSLSRSFCISWSTATHGSWSRWVSPPTRSPTCMRV